MLAQGEGDNKRRAQDSRENLAETPFWVNEDPLGHKLEARRSGTTPHVRPFTRHGAKIPAATVFLLLIMRHPRASSVHLRLVHFTSLVRSQDCQRHPRPLIIMLLTVRRSLLILTAHQDPQSPQL
jgi:hypothetical protein